MKNRIPKFFIIVLVVCMVFAMVAIPTHAVVTEALVASAIAACLDAWGIYLTGNALNTTQVQQGLYDLIDSAGVVIEDLTEYVSFAAGGFKTLVLKPQFITAARTVANYIKSTVFNGSTSGSGSLSSSDLVSSSLSFNYDGGVISYAPVSGVLYSLYYDTDWGSPSVLAFSSSPNVTIIENWKGSPDQCTLSTPVTVNNQVFYYYSYSLGYTGSLPHTNISSIIASTLNPSISVSATSATIPDSTPTDDYYLDTPTASTSESSWIDSLLQSIIDGNSLDFDYSDTLESIGVDTGTIASNTSGILSGIQSLVSSVAAIASSMFDFLASLPAYLASFAGKFAGIWYYVVTWVTSLGSWLTVMYGIWNGLPYAMIVPVYASAVIVIVVGMYRRFFM